MKKLIWFRLMIDMTSALILCDDFGCGRGVYLAKWRRKEELPGC